MHDDPLLDGLLTLCFLHQKPASAAMLTTGLPLPSQRLSAELLPRAAARAGPVSYTHLTLPTKA